ncbi:MAG: CaiB/BaiF CoA-transferase family protein [Chloroflexi bacterium]|nr:CaiB/BaiF CoA-transferase family protein [Chloroflexota bacterium]
MKPLENTRILDLTRLLPGAICTMLLGDMGAEIIKVEDPVTGDYARLMPPLIDGMGAFFRSSNRGKKSIVLDLKQDAGQAVLHRLVEQADALIEGFRPGVTARLGADYQTLRAINPRLVYCSLSGWGQMGPLAHVSGHDLNYIARNGLLGAELNPQTLGAKVADVGGAYVGVMGVLAALLQRERSGRGDYVDVALSEAAMPFAMLGWVLASCRNMGSEALSLGGASACYRLYYCADDEPVALSAVEMKFWANFCVAVGKPEWTALHTATARQPELIEDVSKLFRSKSAADWADLLDDADCCFSRITAPEALHDDPQMKERGMVGITAEGIPWMRSPIRLSGDEPSLLPAPNHGEHTREVLLGNGFNEADIVALLETGVIRQSP